MVKLEGSWRDVKNACRTTVGKKHTEKDATERFKRDLVIAEHTPIRKLHVSWLWEDMPYWVAMEWARHKFEKYIRSQRTDRTGEKRDKKPQDAPVSFEGYANIQNLIDAWRKRLCYQATPEARRYAVQLKRDLQKIAPEIADALVPNCVYRCGCPEMPGTGCGWWDAFIKDKEPERLLSIRERYAMYNAAVMRLMSLGRVVQDGRKAQKEADI